MTSVHIPNQYEHNPWTGRDVKINGKAHKAYLQRLANGEIPPGYEYDEEKVSFSEPNSGNGKRRKWVAVPPRGQIGNPSGHAVQKVHNPFKRVTLTHGPAPQKRKTKGGRTWKKKSEVYKWKKNPFGNDGDGDDDDSMTDASYTDDEGNDSQDENQQFESGQYEDVDENVNQDVDEDMDEDMDGDMDEDMDEDTEHSDGYSRARYPRKHQNRGMGHKGPLQEEIPGHTTGDDQKQVNQLMKDHRVSIQKAYEKHGDSTEFVHFLNALID